MVFSTIVIILLAIAFAFPLYWILTGSFKTQISINSTTPNGGRASGSRRTMTSCSAARSPRCGSSRCRSAATSARTARTSSGGPVPGARRCALAHQHGLYGRCLDDPDLHHLRYGRLCAGKKRFVGRSILFTLIVCAMALPKQVILIPLLREMSSLQLYNTIWRSSSHRRLPFGVFLMKQFSEGIPGEMLEPPASTARARPRPLSVLRCP